MSDTADIMEQAARWREAGKGVALATVVNTWVVAAADRLEIAVDDEGAFVGSVSGGCVEGAVIEEALAAISDGKPRLLDFGVTNEQAWEVGLACGGKIEDSLSSASNEGAVSRRGDRRRARFALGGAGDRHQERRAAAA